MMNDLINFNEILMLLMIPMLIPAVLLIAALVSLFSIVRHQKQMIRQNDEIIRLLIKQQHTKE